MDPINALREILQQLNDLSGAGLDLLSQALGGAEGSEAPEGEGAPAEGGEVPAPPGAPA